MTNKRRGRGEGSIFQRADGLWAVTISLGVDGDGKRRRKTLYGARKRDVQEKLRKFDPAKQVDARGWTLSKLADHWLETVAPRKASASTLVRYKSSINRHIRPHLGHVKLKDFTAATVEAFYATLATLKTNRGKPLSPRTQEMAAIGLTALLKHAVKPLKLIEENFATDLTKPKRAKGDRLCWTQDEARQFLVACRGHQHEVFFITVLGTGIREGEAFALDWQDIDFAKGTLTVRQSLLELSGYFTLKPPKTGRGRVIQLPKVALAALHEHRKKALAAGMLDKPVFHDRNGGYLRCSNFLRYVFYPLVKAAGVRRVTLHDLRHAHASHLLQAGVPIKVVSERLGHATVSITLDVYQSVMPGMQQAAADQVDLLYGPDRLQDRLQSGADFA